jgi:5-methylcytosine-specific restriction endonuclease McrA
MGNPKGNPKYTNEHIRKVYEWYMEVPQRTIADVQERFGISNQTMWKRCKKQGLPLKKGGHPLGTQRVDRERCTCEQCGVGFELTPGEARCRPRRFCGTRCAAAATRKPGRYVDVVCDYCGKNFVKRADHVWERNYCSRECSVEGRRIHRPVEVTCKRCGKTYAKASNRVHENNYCSLACVRAAEGDEKARWREQNGIPKWEDPEYRRTYMRQYAKRNREKFNAHQRRWNKENREKKAITRRRRRAGAKAGDFVLEEWLAIKARYDHRCLGCGRQEPEIALSVDHVVPLAHGGKHTATNIQPLCTSCNSKKGTKRTDFRLMPPA